MKLAAIGFVALGFFSALFLIVIIGDVIDRFGQEVDDDDGDWRD